MFKFLISCCLLLSISLRGYSAPQDVMVINASNKQQDQDKEKQLQKGQEQKKSDQKPDKPEIKEVPKAKRQVKPTAVKPNIKVKTIKIIKPKIKRP